MDQITQQIESLNTRVRRQQYAIVGLSAVLAGMALLGAARPVENATFDKITCREWEVVDTNGEVRISAGTQADGQAGVSWLDKDGKVRIGALTLADGIGTFGCLDKDRKLRISATTSADGGASVTWSDKDGKSRIIAATFADGTVMYPSATGK
jgi:hypothetical protein